MSVVINGSAGVTTNSGAVYNGIASGTAVASTSGTSIDFTSIPSWVKRITVMFNGVSTNGSSFVQTQLGTSGGVQTTSYNSYVGYSTSVGTVGANTNTTGLLVDAGGPNAGALLYGSLTLTLIDSSTSTWVSSGTIGYASAGVYVTFTGGGSKTLSATLDRVRITTVNGTDTFDAGSINILYE